MAAVPLLTLSVTGCARALLAATVVKHAAALGYEMHVQFRKVAAPTRAQAVRIHHPTRRSKPVTGSRKLPK